MIHVSQYYTMDAQKLNGFFHKAKFTEHDESFRQHSPMPTGTIFEMEDFF